MAKKKIDPTLEEPTTAAAVADTTDEAIAVDAPPPDPIVLKEYGGDTEPNGIVTLEGGGNGSGAYRVATPFPFTISVNGSSYYIADRAAGRYTWRHP